MEKNVDEFSQVSPVDIVEAEVQKDIAPIREDDPEMAKYFEEVQRDYRNGEYRFLKWIDEVFSFESVLYAGSGSDIIPRMVFGKERVVHTSLEHYFRGGDVDYFPELGEGKRVVSDNSFLPFGDEVFQMLFVSAYPVQLIEAQLDEMKRVIASNGLIVFTYSVLNDDRVNLDLLENKAERIVVPEEYQEQGESELEFLVFRKN